MRNKIYEERYKILVIIIIFIILSLLTYFIHFILEVDIIYTHLLYFPTILACFWWKKKGLVLTIFIVGFLIFFPVFIRPNIINIENILRMLIIISIGLFIVFLSEKISNVTDDLLENEKKLKKLNMELEQKVNERTKELKKSYELLKKSREQLNAIFSNLKDPIFVISEDYKILFKNENANEIFGEELAGRNCYEIIKGLDHPCEHCPIRTFKEKDICEVRFEQCVNTPLIDGTKIFDIVTSKIENYGGESVIVEVFRDITERKKADEEIRKAKFFSESILDSLPGVFYFFDENGKFLRWNKNFEVVSEYSAGEISKMSILDFFIGDDKTNIAERIQEVFIKGKSSAEADFISKSGKKTPHYFTGLRIIIDDIPYLGGMGIDISERKKMDKELEKSEKKYREAYNRADFYKDLFAHDINNILQSILSGMQLNKEYLNMPEKLGDLKENYRIIEEQILRGARLVSNVRKLSKLEDIQILNKKIEICNLLEKSITYIKDSYKERNVNVQIDYSVGKKLYITANDFIEDLFENIMINAIKHNQNPVVEITIKISREQKNDINYNKIEFLDNGKGIPDSRKKEIFQRGYSEKRSVHGMGLGLSLVKKIIDTYNGEIWVEDKIKGDHSKGSNFVLLIPEVV